MSTALKVLGLVVACGVIAAAAWHGGYHEGRRAGVAAERAYWQSAGRNDPHLAERDGNIYLVRQWNGIKPLAEFVR